MSGKGKIVKYTDEESDRRAQRTRELLNKAMFGLMVEKRYDKITVQDIIDRANVGRSTFYDHYQDKEELAVSSLVHMFEQLNATLAGEQKDDERLLPCAELFHHVAENYPAFKALMQGHGLDVFFEKSQAYWSEKIEAGLRGKIPPGKTPRMPLDVVSAFAAGTFVWMLKWWLDHKMPYTPEQMDDMIHQMVLPSINNAIG